MTNLIRRNNRGFGLGASPLGSLFEDFFDATTSPFTPLTTTFSSVADASTRVTETETAHQIAVAAPGLAKKDFNITVKQAATGTNVLTVSYEAGDTTTAGFVQGSFRRSWTLPRGTTTESVTASYRSGVLTVSVEKPNTTTADATETTITVK